MQSDVEPLTLSKWPFYLGDALLVATALAIAILGDWQLSDWQVGSCVMAVALGAGVFVLPFVVEYYMRVGEVREGRSADMRQLQKHLDHAASLLAAFDKRLEVLESPSGAAPQINEARFAGLEQKLALIESFRSEQSATLDALQQEVQALGARFELSSKDDGLADLKANVDELKVRLGQLGEPDAGVDARLNKLEAALTKKPPAPEPAEELPVRALRKRRQADARLMDRAIKEKPDSASSAVSRIIHSKNRRAAVSAKTVKVKVATATASDVIEPDSVEEPVEIAATREPTVLQTPLEEVEVSLGAEKVEGEALLQSEPIEELPPESAQPAVGKQEPALEDVVKAPVEPSESADFFGEVATPASRPSRTKKNDAVLTVNILIGIGNRPYLRGSGGGLSWAKGIPMDFEEIGKWRWIAPADVGEALELQVYRNDEDADRTGKHVLEPGQRLEVEPIF
jgi:hypothetical protein